MTPTLAISPCPNDTYAFAPLLQHPPFPLQVSFQDIQTLNEGVFNQAVDFSKISCGFFPQIAPHYVLLPVGATLGFGMGPKILAKKPFSLHEFSQKRLAVPGKHTTANQLLDALCPPPLEKVFCFYHEVLDLIANDKVDAGLILHETRFTFHRYQLQEVADLGQLWQDRFRLPLPLGAIVAKRTLPREIIDTFTAALQQSFIQAPKDFEANQPFIIKHSQEKNLKVIHKHIQLYVNKESKQLSSRGKKAFEALFSLFSYSPPKDWLYEQNLSGV